MAGYRGHLAGGIIVGVGLIYGLSKVNLMPYFESTASLLKYVGGCALGALLPDIDHPKSMLGSKLSPISDLLYSTVGHRTLTHSILFSFVVGILITMAGQPSLGLGTFVGCISHIMLDLLSSGNGVAFLYPFYKKRIRLH